MNELKRKPEKKHEKNLNKANLHQIHKGTSIYRLQAASLAECSMSVHSIHRFYL